MMSWRIRTLTLNYCPTVPSVQAYMQVLIPSTAEFDYNSCLPYPVVVHHNIILNILTSYYPEIFRLVSKLFCSVNSKFGSDDATISPDTIDIYSSLMTSKPILVASFYTVSTNGVRPVAYLEDEEEEERNEMRALISNYDESLLMRCPP